jgi:hypothetical protein
MNKALEYLEMEIHILEFIKNSKYLLNQQIEENNVKIKDYKEAITILKSHFINKKGS